MDDNGEDGRGDGWPVPGSRSRHDYILSTTSPFDNVQSDLSGCLTMKRVLRLYTVRPRI